MVGARCCKVQKCYLCAKDLKDLVEGLAQAQYQEVEGSVIEDSKVCAGGLGLYWKPGDNI